MRELLVRTSLNMDLSKMRDMTPAVDNINGLPRNKFESSKVSVV